MRTKITEVNLSALNLFTDCFMKISLHGYGHSSSSFSWPLFGQQLGYRNGTPGNKISMKLHLYTHG